MTADVPLFVGNFAHHMRVAKLVRATSMRMVVGHLRESNS